MNVLSAIVNIGSSQTGRQFRTESLVVPAGWTAMLCSFWQAGRGKASELQKVQKGQTTRTRGMCDVQS